LREIRLREASKDPSTLLSAPLSGQVTRETDAAYMQPVERGDTAEAQRLVDEAAKAAGYDVKGYHGSPDLIGDSFDRRFLGRNIGLSRGAVVATGAPVNWTAAVNPLLAGAPLAGTSDDNSTDAAKAVSARDVSRGRESIY
jgi:hypothetical protein